MKSILVIFAALSAFAFAAPAEADGALANREAAVEGAEANVLSKRQNCGSCNNGKKWCTICSGGVGGCVGNYYPC